MGFFDDIKKGIQSAANAVEEAKKREAERANACESYYRSGNCGAVLRK